MRVCLRLFLCEVHRTNQQSVCCCGFPSNFPNAEGSKHSRMENIFSAAPSEIIALPGSLGSLHANSAVFMQHLQIVPGHIETTRFFSAVSETIFLRSL
jgi:hypothetical protein